jgi:hypothetical protein
MVAIVVSPGRSAVTDRAGMSGVRDEIEARVIGSVTFAARSTADPGRISVRSSSWLEAAKRITFGPSKGSCSGSWHAHV